MGLDFIFRLIPGLIVIIAAIMISKVNFMLFIAKAKKKHYEIHSDGKEDIVIIEK